MQIFTFSLPAPYRITLTEWLINGIRMGNNTPTFTIQKDQGKDLRIEARTLAQCDTCLTLISFCGEFTSVKQALITSTAVPVKAESPDLQLTEGWLNADQLAALGISPEPILFSSNTNREESDFIRTLEKNAAILIKHPNLYIELTGHADEKGEPDYNEKLSLERAKHIRLLLINMGVKKQQILTVRGAGEKEPAVRCNTGSDCPEETLRKNRRVEMKVYHKKPNGSQ